ncbi:hypothetical protein HZS55_15845 [Halosimplex rubrum]|uniref:Uncharacterized protein n=1 Tax=Halosimplex rubrum TaxID=869889 RepID=A0A7D5T6W5_9EURY|nr:hypothetical protein [Halosimplex rubrum]QLH78669.1 hypothetical protein HZS55_15845 [Halosimplex rubrum]
MTLRQLHALRIGELVQNDSRTSKRRRMATAGALGDDTAAVETVAPEAGEQGFQYMVVGGYASLTATAVEELAGASTIGAVPYASPSGSDPQRDGYYVIDDDQSARPIASSDIVHRLDIRLTEEGTRGSHWRAVAARPDAVDNPFGDGGDAEIGLHAGAEKVRWFDDRGGSGAIEDATVQRTVAGERTDFEIYDATEPSFSQPTLIYTLDYTDEYQADVHLWDDNGRSKTVVVDEGGGSEVGTATVGDATVGGGGTDAVRWGRVYSTGHDFVGAPVAETGRLRLRFDENRGRIEAYRWNDADAHYDRVQLDLTSDWRLFDVDVTHIGLARIDLQVEFRDTSTSALTTQNLNCSLKRGYDDALWMVPPNASSPPQGLVDRVDAIASTQGSDPAAGAELVERTRVNE